MTTTSLRTFPSGCLDNDPSTCEVMAPLEETIHDVTMKFYLSLTFFLGL